MDKIKNTVWRSSEVSQLPKLRVKWWGRWEKTIDLKHAKSLIPFGRSQALDVVVEGQSITSYEELVQIATQDNYKDKEILEVAVIMPVGGGS